MTDLCQRKIAKHQPFLRHLEGWSLALYEGSTLASLAPMEGVRTPLLTAHDVTDARAAMIADPFLVRRQGLWWVFFEVWNMESRRGEIGCAKSVDGRTWVYQRIVLQEPFHVSYPYVVEWKNDVYMIPESAEDNCVRLYRAVEFPWHWQCERTLLHGRYVDTSVFMYDGRWWMFTASNQNDTLYLFYADSVQGPWKEHPQSPIVKNDLSRARPGGRMVQEGGGWIRFAQDDSGGQYGNRVRAFEITILTVTEYAEQERMDITACAASGVGWNARGMHTIDAQRVDGDWWIAAVDGFEHDKLFCSY